MDLNTTEHVCSRCGTTKKVSYRKIYDNLSAATFVGHLCNSCWDELLNESQEMDQLYFGLLDTGMDEALASWHMHRYLKSFNQYSA